MAYCCDLPHGPKLYLDNQANQTIVQLLMMQPGQQQQSSHSLTTGVWLVPPEIFAVGNGVMVKLVTSIGEFMVQIQGMTMQSGMQSGSVTTGGTPIAVTSIDAMPTSTSFSSQSAQSSQPMQPMQPMAPMQPMQMGNMQMNLKPMQMQMGNMQMNMGTETAATTVNVSSTNGASGTAKFCSQCGNPVKPGDRFCSSCGHTLS
jgi:zinc-ribbon domain